VHDSRANGGIRRLGLGPRIVYEFEEAQPNTINFGYSPNADEQLSTVIENGCPILYLSRSGLLTLAKLLIKMSLGPYTDGFHVHLRKTSRGFARMSDGSSERATERS
jgi:hypothetical protein